MDMKDKNKKTLQKALGNLPQYQPEDSVWFAVEEEMETFNQQSILKRGVSRLGTYQPPEDLWENIEEELARPNVRWLNWRRAASIAAVLSGLLICGNLIFNNPIQAEAEVQYSFSEEEWRPGFSITDFSSDELPFDALEKICETQPGTCNDPIFSALKSELEELNLAKEGLLSNMTEYNEDPALIAQLTKIEQQRSTLIKKLMAVI